MLKRTAVREKWISTSQGAVGEVRGMIEIIAENGCDGRVFCGSSSEEGVATVYVRA